MSSLQRLIVVLVAVTALALGIYASLFRTNLTYRQEGDPSSVIHATVLPGPKTLASFSLTDQHGAPFTADSLRGRWSFLFFGYTYCPDICPTTLAELARMDQLLQSDEVRIPYQVVFVSVDPERDTADRLAEYVSYFSASFLGVSGSEEELSRLTRPLGVIYARVESKGDPAGYLMDHSAAIILVDPEGRFHAVFSAPHQPKEMAEDLVKIAG